MPGLSPQSTCFAASGAGMVLLGCSVAPGAYALQVHVCPRFRHRPRAAPVACRATLRCLQLPRCAAHCSGGPGSLPPPCHRDTIAFEAGPGVLAGRLCCGPETCACSQQWCRTAFSGGLVCGKFCARPVHGISRQPQCYVGRGMQSSPRSPGAPRQPSARRHPGSCARARRLRSPFCLAIAMAASSGGPAAAAASSSGGTQAGLLPRGGSMAFHAPVRVSEPMMAWCSPRPAVAAVA